MKDIDLLFSGVDRTQWKRILPFVREDNRKFLLAYSVLATVMLLIFSCMPDSISFFYKNHNIYFGATVLLLALFLVTFFVTNKHPFIINILTYVQAVIFWLIGLFIRLYGSESTAQYSVTAVVVITVVPFLFTYKPFFSMIMTIGFSVGFEVILFTNKPSAIGVGEIINVCIFSIIGIIAGIYTLRSKIRRFILEEEKIRLLFTDELTGMNNRRKYQEKVEELATKEDLDVTIIFLDVNGLKKTNDSIGHMAGDELIKGAAKCIVTAYEKYGSCYRVGGDEFVCVIENHDYSESELRAELDRQLRFYYGTLEDTMTIACGISKSVEHKKLTIQQVVDVADEEMYKNKRQMYSNI